jgi:hypothetical protein
MRVSGLISLEICFSFSKLAFDYKSHSFYSGFSASKIEAFKEDYFS